MKHDAWRLDPAHFPLRGQLQPRWSDVDRWQHLNNSALIALHGENLQRWLQQHFGPQVWRQTEPAWVTVAQATDFLAEGRYPEPLDTGVRLEQVGADHLLLASSLWQGGRCIGRHQAWLQPWHAQQPQAWPGPLAGRLQGLLAAQPPLPSDGGEALPGGGPVAASAARPATPSQLAWPLSGAVPRLADFAWQGLLASRYADHDALDHLADAALARCAEQIRVEFLTHALGAQRRQSTTGFMVGHVALRKLARGAAPAQWRVGCGVTRLGDRSLAVRGALFDGAQPAAWPQAQFEAVLVTVDRAQRRATALPDWVRQGLQPWVLHAGAEQPAATSAPRP